MLALSKKSTEVTADSGSSDNSPSKKNSFNPPFVPDRATKFKKQKQPFKNKDAFNQLK